MSNSLLPSFPLKESASGRGSFLSEIIGQTFANFAFISIKALDCFPKARGTAASGQAFSQMLVSSVVAGLVIPIIWGSLATLAIGMLVIFSLGLITITKTQAWKDEELLLDE